MKIVGQKCLGDAQRKDQASEEDVSSMFPIFWQGKDANEPHGSLTERHEHGEYGIHFDRVQFRGPLGVTEPNPNTKVKQEVQDGHKGPDRHHASSIGGLEVSIGRKRTKQNGEARQKSFSLRG